MKSWEIVAGGKFIEFVCVSVRVCVDGRDWVLFFLIVGNGCRIKKHHKSCKDQISRDQSSLDMCSLDWSNLYHSCLDIILLLYVVTEAHQAVASPCSRDYVICQKVVSLFLWVKRKLLICGRNVALRIVI